MGSRNTVGGRDPRINVTPYIDILLVLLIIFMVIQPTGQFDLEARVPQEADRDHSGPAAVIVVSIDKDFRLAINGEAVPMEKLGLRLFEILRSRRDRSLFVQGDPGLPFGGVARVIDVAKGAGAGDVGLTVPPAS